MDKKQLERQLETLQTCRAKWLDEGEVRTIPNVKLVMKNLSSIETFAGNEYLTWRKGNVTALYWAVPLELIDPVRGVFRELHKIRVWINANEKLTTGDIVCNYSYVEEDGYMHPAFKENYFIPGEWEKIVEVYAKKALEVIENNAVDALREQVEKLEKMLLWGKEI